MRRLALVLVALSALLTAACGGEDGNGGQTAVDDGGDAAAQTVPVAATEFAFEPSDLTADPGEITFELMNEGGAPHALAIEGNGVDESSDTIEGGDSTSFTIELEEGQYEIYCPVGDHADRGMVGTLTVGAAAGAGGATTTNGETDAGETSTEHDETETGDDDGGDSSGSGSGGY